MKKTAIQLTIKEISDLLDFIRNYNWKSVRKNLPFWSRNIEIYSYNLLQKLEYGKPFYRLLPPNRVFAVLFTRLDISIITIMVKYSKSCTGIELETVRQHVRLPKEIINHLNF